MIKKENWIHSLIFTNGLIGLILTLMAVGFVAKIFFWEEINTWIEGISEKYSFIFYTVLIIFFGYLTLWQYHGKKKYESDGPFSLVRLFFYAGLTVFCITLFLLEYI